MIEEGCLAGVGLFGFDHNDPFEVCLVSDHVHHHLMRDADKVLIDPLSHIAGTFLAFVLPDNDRRDIMA